MDEVYVVLGEHFEIAGIHMSVHSTTDGANKMAAELVAIMVKDADVEVEGCDNKTWETALGVVQDEHDDCGVTIFTCKIQD